MPDDHTTGLGSGRFADPPEISWDVPVSRARIPGYVHEALTHIPALSVVDVDEHGALLSKRTNFESRMGEIQLRFEELTPASARVIAVPRSPLAISGPFTTWDDMLLRRFIDELRLAIAEPIG